MKHLTLSLLILATVALAGCEQPAYKADTSKPDAKVETSQPKDGIEIVPVVPVAATGEPCATPGQNTPTKPIISKGKKRIWAKTSYLWTEAPKFVVEGWINRKTAPDMTKKYVLIEFWNTWCPPCRRSLAKLQHWQEKFGKDLVVIAICDESRDVQTKFFQKPEYKDYTFPQAIDTQNVMKEIIGVYGVPHALLIEPSGRVVIWEGFPLLPGHELTDEMIQGAIAIGRKNGDIPVRK
ncbi:MAG: TlpA family protein disulfide reductase [Phycisphaerales bacterium]|jgi:cytochrome c biogenesis protein CcmG, thiol:disulfide interchange protein DsbE|nr:TlpA family protein disulfide reductase [Phycisphaerales bacterium]MBT7172003.1 TlpA family protein disulfide reductase [Phycisphaerales bacterium]